MVTYTPYFRLDLLTGDCVVAGRSAVAECIQEQCVGNTSHAAGDV